MSPFFKVSMDEFLVDIARHDMWASKHGSGACLNVCALDLQGYDFSGVTLHNARFMNCDLRGADFSSSVVHGSNFSGSNLEGAKFKGRTLYETNFQGASMRGAWIDTEQVEIPPLCPMGLGEYHVLITEQYMYINCRKFTHEEWWGFTDGEIMQMDTGPEDGIQFWHRWKGALFLLCKGHREHSIAVVAGTSV